MGSIYELVERTGPTPMLRWVVVTKSHPLQLTLDVSVTVDW